MAYMFAYGSNLNVEQMARRCPTAKPIGWIKLPDWRLVFRNVADIEPAKDDHVYGGIWEITPEDEAALDIYEGIRSELYRKEYLPIKELNGEHTMLVYLMNSDGVFPPSTHYFNGIEQGYRDFKMPRAAYTALSIALKRSWDEQHPSHHERQRYRRTGRPTLTERNNLRDRLRRLDKQLREDATPTLEEQVKQEVEYLRERQKHTKSSGEYRRLGILIELEQRRIKNKPLNDDFVETLVKRTNKKAAKKPVQGVLKLCSSN